jgi:hypothetical protein
MATIDKARKLTERQLANMSKMEMSIWPSTTQFEQHFRLVQHCIDVILHKTKESVNFFQLALDSTHLSFSPLQLLCLCCARKEDRLPIGSCCWTSQNHHTHLAHQCSSKRTETFVLQASIVRTLETPRSSVKTTKNMYIYIWLKSSYHRHQRNDSLKKTPGHFTKN